MNFDQTIPTPSSPSVATSSERFEDNTSLSDHEDHISTLAFQAKWDDKNGLRVPTVEEEKANRSPFLPWPPKGSAEERNLHDHIVKNMRRLVKDLEEDELFQQTLLRGSLLGTEEPLKSSNVDSILSSMMPEDDIKASDGPWKNYGAGGSSDLESEDDTASPVKSMKGKKPAKMA